MKRHILKLMVASFFLAAPGHAGLLQSLSEMLSTKALIPPKTVKVLIAHNIKGAVIGVDGKYKIFDPNTKSVLTTRTVGKTKYMEAMPDGLKWAEEFPGTFQLQLIPVKTSGVLTVNGVEYKGTIYVYNIEEKISIVNETTVEDYVAVLLSANVNTPMEEETMNALAIAARTHALYQAAHPRNHYWTVDGTQVGFKGYDVVKKEGSVTKAIVETHNLSLTLGQGDPAHFPAEWSNVVGGTKEREPAVFSRITVNQADTLAKQGLTAPDILSRAFPGARLQSIK
jgi:hypothetical protein